MPYNAFPQLKSLASIEGFKGFSNPIDLSSEGVAAGYVPTADGAGNTTWQPGAPGAIHIESSREDFVAQSQKAVAFTTPFVAIPAIVCNAEDNVNAYPINSTVNGFTIQLGAVITGTVNWIAK